MMLPFVHFCISTTTTAKTAKKQQCAPAVFTIAEPPAVQDFRGERDSVG
jgi:hypothetical protein